MRALIVGGNSSLGKSLKPVLSNFMDVFTAGRSGCDVLMDLKQPIGNISHDVIIHTAAYFGNDEEESKQVNVIGSLNLCKAASQCKHFVFISSMSVHLDYDSPYRNIYAISKKYAEISLKSYCQHHKIPLTILRPSQIYGPSHDFAKHRPFIYTVAERAKLGHDIEIFGSHDALRNYIYIDDLVNVIVNVIDKGIVGEYDCCGTENISCSRIARAANFAFGKNSKVIFKTEKIDMPDNIFPIDTSLYQAIGYYPATCIEVGMENIARNPS